MYLETVHRLTQTDVIRLDDLLWLKHNIPLSLNPPSTQANHLDIWVPAAFHVTSHLGS